MSVRSNSRVESGPMQVARRLTGPWWGYLLAGIAWVLISVVILRFNIASVATVGLLLGALFLLSAVEEFVIASVRPTWGWAHALRGVLGARVRPGHPARRGRHDAHHHGDLQQGLQRRVVARRHRRTPGSLHRLLGLGTVVPRAGGVPDHLGWPAGAVPRRLRDRAGVRNALGAVAARECRSRPGNPLSCRCRMAMSYRVRFPAIAPG